MIVVHKPIYSSTEVEPLYRKCKDVCQIRTALLTPVILFLIGLVLVTTSSALDGSLVLDIIAISTIILMFVSAGIFFRKLFSKYEKFCDRSKIEDDSDALAEYMKNLLSYYKAAEELCVIPENILKEAKIYHTPNGFEINGKEYCMKEDALEKIVYVKDNNETHLLFTELDAMFNEILPYVAEKIEFTKDDSNRESNTYERIDFC